MSLPAADELFRTTGGPGVQPSSSRQHVNGDTQPGGSGVRMPPPAGEAAPAAEPGAAEGGEAPGRGDAAEPASGRDVPAARSASGGPEQGTRADSAAGKGRQAAGGSRRGRAAPRRPSGRERHDEKITVYVSAEELMDLEHARLVLRGEHGLAVDRGRIVREAVAVVLADLESRGDASILVRRLRGR
ncbi:hypothetical protein QNO07_19865 [Streptomyces sp. 549]|uniref:hypothetical protein n=1 Tax=Streptomyces sp. 549 TaxID=3049076 RepID=UPI0024C39CCA|nr:hypothetical protein [Streptomyces sp. 549]MDK1475644.1 hypothetical protein [Streptomyces sp. 549]